MHLTRLASSSRAAGVVMTLYELIVGSGVVVSSMLFGVLAAYWPFERKDHVLCFKQMPDEECSPSCLKDCDLVKLAA